jgi:neural Wiskott-Aldrich syndrome protein
MPQSSADQLQSIPMSPSLGQSLGKAKDFAREQSHRAMTLEHLLLALTEDTDAAGVLRACNIDIDRLGTDVSSYLGNLLEDMRAPPGTEPDADPELLRVVEAARQAASQSRRRAIDGAIVLAAIVGDAKSPAAGLLKAHGMTFEEAIKTLQKASAQARSKQFSSSAQRAPAERPATEQPENGATRAASPGPTSATEATSAIPTAEDFLAAARARIQQRSASTAGKSEAQGKSPPKSPQGEPEDLSSMSPPTLPANRTGADPQPPVDGAPGQAAPAAPVVQAAPAVQAAGPSPATAEVVPPPPGPIAPSTPAEARPPPPPGPPRSFPAGAEGLQQGPAPAGGGSAPPPPRLPDRPPRSDRGDGAAQLLKRPSAPNGALSGQRRPGVEAAARPPARRQAAPSSRGQRAAAGPLMEAIPRKMRVGSAASAQVRIGRDKVDSLMQLLMGNRAQHHPEAIVARVLSVRLRAPDGGFSIEPRTPESQWFESVPGQLQEDHVSWHWTVTPHRRGYRRLQLHVSARMVGRDGIATETAPPERAIEVTVRPSLVRRLVRWVIVVGLLSVGTALGRLSQDKLAQDLLDVGGLIIKSIVGLLRTSGFLAG